ncbi:MAG: hypothetical protein FJ207_12060 [Gemmatimonadetes bacterium]|nr:hypothetical protein [Gemmatimonadota bacterium]
MDLNISGSGSSGAPAPQSSEPEPDLSRRALIRAGLAKGSLALTAFGAGLGIDALWARIVRGPDLERADYPRLVIGSMRVHHSIVGYAAVVLGLVYSPAILIPLGLGIIVGHGRRDRYGFLERVDRP